MPRLSPAVTFLAALLAGTGVGLWLPDLARNLEWMSDIFLRVIRSIIAPLLFGVIVNAVAGAGNMHNLSRIAWRAVVIFEVATTVALLLGWTTATLIPAFAISTSAPPQPAQSSAIALLVSAFPTSIFDAMARGDVLQILVFSLIFGAAATLAGDRAKPLLDFAASITAISFVFTRLTMKMAPFAVFAAIAATVARSAQGTIASLGAFIGAAWIAQVLFMIIVIGGSVVAAGVPLRKFITAVKEPFLVAFATTSSAAAMPKALDAMEQLGVKRDIYGIVAPLSLSFNLTGSCIHLAMCSFFAARAAGIDLPLTSALLILLLLKFTSKGVAGIPRANFVVLTGVFTTFGLPAEMLTVLLGIDALIDPVRTSTNVLGHCAAPPLLERWLRSDHSGTPSFKAEHTGATPDTFSNT